MSDFSTEAESWAGADTGATPIVQIRGEVEQPVSCSPRQVHFLSEKTKLQGEGDARTGLARLRGHDVAGADIQC